MSIFVKMAGRSVFTAAFLAAATLGASAQSGSVTISGFGGNLQEDLVRTLWGPAAEKAGITLNQATNDGLASVRVQIQSGTPGWDVIHLGADECAAGQREGLFEAIDYDVVDASGVSDAAKGEAWVAINSYSDVLAWRTDVYGDNPPKSWKDFWDVEKFPGRRAMGASPQESLEIALLADGVKPEELYPLDVERGLASLEKIKPHISVWWSSGAQSAQLIKDGEVDMIEIWGSRVASVIKDGAPVAFTYQDGILGYGCLAILKGSANLEAAQKFIAGVISPEIQARIPEMMGYYGPTNQKAFDVKEFPEEMLSSSNTSPENAAKQIPLNIDWWRENEAEVVEQYRNMRIE